MSSDETLKIEPTLTSTDAAASAGAPAPAAAKIESAAAKSEAAKSETIKSETIQSETETVKLETAAPTAKTETPVIEAAAEVKAEAPTDEPRIEATLPKIEPSLPPAAQLEPAVVAFKKPQPSAASTQAVPARSSRFALLAASVAIAASFGAIGGSLGAAKFGPMLTSAPEPVAPVAKEQVAEEVRALKESVAQLRATTRALNENFTALKAGVSTASTQNGKVAEALERIEKGQAEQRKLATAAPATVPAHMVSTSQVAQQAAPEVTGSIAPKGAAPMVLGTPPQVLKPPTVPGFVLRRVYDGAALIEGRDGMIEVEPGVVAPGLGRIEAIKREDGRWVVVTARGVVR